MRGEKKLCTKPNSPRRRWLIFPFESETSQDWWKRRAKSKTIERNHRSCYLRKKKSGKKIVQKPLKRAIWALKRWTIIKRLTILLWRCCPARQSIKQINARASSCFRRDMHQIITLYFTESSCGFFSFVFAVASARSSAKFWLKKRFNQREHYLFNICFNADHEVFCPIVFDFQPTKPLLEWFHFDAELNFPINIRNRFDRHVQLSQSIYLIIEVVFCFDSRTKTSASEA